MSDRWGILVGLLALVLGAGLMDSPRSSAQEPEIDAPPLADWRFRAWPIGASGAHPIAQLPDGGLVIGTEEGLVRFDGLRISALPLPKALVTPVTLLFVDVRGTLHVICADASHMCITPDDAWVCTSRTAAPNGEGNKGPVPTTICGDRDGSVWVGHRNGLVSRTIGRDTTWIETATNDTWPREAAVQVAADTSGRVWMARKGCLAVWRDGGWVAHRVPLNSQPTLAAASDGGLWIRDGGPVFHFDQERGVTRTFKPGVPTTHSLHEDAMGRLWMATTRYGLVVWDGDRLATAPTTAPSIYSVFTDREGGLWAGTTAGIERGGPRIVRRIEMPTIKPLRAVRTTAAEDLWFITLDGELGCQRHAAATFPSRLDGWKHGVVTALGTAADGTLWLGTKDGGIVRMSGDPTDGRTENLSLPPDLRGLVVRSLAASPAGLWVAIGPHLVWTDGNQWLRSDPRMNEAAADVTVVVSDDAGNAWAATANGAILRAGAPSAGLRQSGGTPSPSAGIAVERMTPRDLPAGAAVTAICPVADGGVWVVTRLDGLWRWRAGGWAHVGTQHGLPSATLLAAEIDKQGRMWCAGSHMFFAATLAELDAVAVGTHERCHCWMTSDENELAFFDPMIVPPNIATRDPNGRILVVLPTGLAVCDPDRLPATAPPPQVDVIAVRADGRKIAPFKSRGFATPARFVATAPADTRSVSITLAERSLAAQTNARVQHRLSGIDDDWIDTPSDRIVNYERLPAGRHSLELRSTTDTATWESGVQSIVIDVEPRLLERPWFRAAVVLGVATAAGGVAFGIQAWRSNRRIARFREAAALDRERMRIARDMHDEVGTSLTQISLLTELIRRQTARGAAGALDDVTSIARATVSSLDEIVWAVNPRHDTLPHLLSYVSLHASQSLSRLEIACTIDAPEVIASRPAPTDFRRAVLFIVKEAIGNVTKHADARNVTLSIRIDAGRLPKLTIADDGRGPAATAPGDRPRPATGLENMRARAADIGGTCTVGPRAGGGTIVVVDVPLPAT